MIERRVGLLFRSENCVLRHLCHSKFNDRRGRNLDLLERLRIDPRTRFPFLLYQLAKAGRALFQNANADAS